ncbi:tetratricopeptide repeat protein, partial [Streptomyces sp. V4-01]|nr:tetratricopeptide repeat protein [Streptomyces sp. V4-01]
MAVPERERVSRGEMRRRDEGRRFIGRRAESTLFIRSLDCENPGAEAFLFHVRGVGGIGKSTILERWQEEARADDIAAVTAKVGENDALGIVQALTSLARQLAEASGLELKGFDKVLRSYLSERAAAAVGATRPVDGGPSQPSQTAAKMMLETAKAFPGGGVVGAVADQETMARGIDWGYRALVGRKRREPEGDVAGLSRAFVTELDRISLRRPSIVLFFDTWERTGPYLNGWLPKLLNNEFGEFPSNVIIVLAGRDRLPEREWAVWRSYIQDIPLRMFTREETRSLLAQHGVVAPEVVDAVQERSGGLPLAVGLLAQTRPTTAAEVGRGGVQHDEVVEWFLQGVDDPQQRETVVACALPRQLDEEIFAAAAPREGNADAPDLWGWLCRRSFVTGHDGHKQYHAIVRANMIGYLHTGYPQRWGTTHLRLADVYATRRAKVEEELADEQAARRIDGDRTLSETALWADERWRQHRAAETYHRLCASPHTSLRDALEQTAHAARQDLAILRQWIDMLEQAAQDSFDASVRSWTDRLKQAVTDADSVSALACWTVLLTYGQLTTTGRAFALAFCGDQHAEAGSDRQAMRDLEQALSLAPRNHRIRNLRGEAHRRAGRFDEAVADYTAALNLNPTAVLTLALRGAAHRQAGRFDEAVTDYSAALELDPTLDYVFVGRGVAHREARRFDEAVADYTAALQLDPSASPVLALRGEAHRQAGRFGEAVADYTAALEVDPSLTWLLVERGEAHRQAGRFDEAVADYTAALQQDPIDA